MKCKLLPALLLALLALATPAFAAGSVPLGNPVNLQWDKDHPGLVRWETARPYQGFCYLSFYQENDPSPIWSAQLEHGAGESGPFEASYFKYHALASQDLPSGNYFFTVQNLGDGTAYSDSAEVSSGVYAYVEPGPDTALETPAAGHWEWPIAVWDDRQDTDPDVDGYLVEYGWSKTEAASPDEICGAGSTARLRSGKRNDFFEEQILSSFGAGWYYFRVRPVSANIEARRCGEWSGWSQGYHQDALGALDAILNAGLPADELRDAVQALDPAELKSALAADIPGAPTGAAEALSKLEALLGGPATPEVAPELQSVFDAAKVSIVGAALNDPSGAGSPILSIGKPQADHVLDAVYDSALAVNFSMTLLNTVTPHDLAVPVKVTLPVPTGVNPDFLAILHYRADGGCEEVLHTVFERGGQWYASFVLTGFSDFTLTERLGAAIQTTPGGGYQAVNAPTGARLLLARYEGTRFRSLEVLESLSGTLSGSGRLFLLDGEYRPLCPAGDLQP